MVQLSLTLGAVVGIALSAGYVWYEVGRYAAPQVPVSRFDERKEMIGYTAGLFAGIPLAVALLFLLAALPLGELGGVAIYLAVLVGGTELAQWLILKSVYFGSDGSGPFYALGFRAGVAGILILAVVAQALASPALSGASLAVALAQSVAILFLGVAGGVLSLPVPTTDAGRRGGPGAGAAFGAVGFFLVALGPAFGPAGGVVAAAFAALVAASMYRRLGRATLDKLRPPRSALPSDDDEPERPSGFGRTDE